MNVHYATIIKTLWIRIYRLYTNLGENKSIDDNNLPGHYIIDVENQIISEC